MNRHFLKTVTCIMASLVLLSYIALFGANAFYLGLKDASVFITQNRFWVRLWLTLYTSFFATILSLLVGIPLGYALSRLKLPFPRLTSSLIDLPVMVPPATIGVFLFGFTTTFPMKLLLDGLGLELSHSTAGVIFVQFVVTMAFCARLMKASFDNVNPRFEHVSRSLGYSLPGTFKRVTLPLAKNGILASAVVVWARAAAEWEGLMLFVGGTMGQTDVLPFSVYLDWNGALMGEVVTYSLASVIFAFLAVGFMYRLGGKSYVW